MQDSTTPHSLIIKELTPEQWKKYWSKTNNKKQEKAQKSN